MKDFILAKIIWIILQFDVKHDPKVLIKSYLHRVCQPRFVLLLFFFSCERRKLSCNNVISNKVVGRLHSDSVKKWSES